jgi:hypothetical protein
LYWKSPSTDAVTSLINREPLDDVEGPVCEDEGTIEPPLLDEQAAMRAAILTKSARFANWCTGGPAFCRMQKSVAPGTYTCRELRRFQHVYRGRPAQDSAVGLT